MNFQKVFKFICQLLLLIVVFNLRAQEPEQVNDSLKNKYDLGSINLPDPKSIIESYTYNPVTDRYIYTKSIDQYTINFPLILTRKEYEEIVLRAQMRLYFMEKFNTTDGRSKEEVQRDMLPSYYVNSNLFKGIFGSNEITVKPQGFVEMDLGMRYTKQENPSISPRNRSMLTLDFDQRIGMGLQGKIGTLLGVTANYDTQSTFDFQNVFKLEYNPPGYNSNEDDILQKLEVGNVSMPISSSLIRGAQSLFGIKAALQFGKTTITAIASEQKSQTKSIVSEGGGTMEEFELSALDYDADRHFFLSQYFRNKYDSSLKNYPYINSRVKIIRVDVWITNRQNRIIARDNSIRNIIAIQDLGEGRLNGIDESKIIGINTLAYPDFFVNQQPDIPTDNKNNKFDPGKIGSNFLNDGIRTITAGASGFNIPATEGRDFVKLESGRKLSPNEFTFHPQLGYISLQQRLSNDEVLAVAYQYTIGDKIYQVGEFGTDGGETTTLTPNTDPTQTPIPTTQSLVLKMLKSNLTSVDQPIWNLMMKNIYDLPGAMQLSQYDFKFNILYTDPTPLNYISQSGSDVLPSDVEKTPLLKVFNLDRLDYNNDPQNGGDGFFDYIANGVGQDPMNLTGEGAGGAGPNTGGYAGPISNEYNSNIFEGITIDERNGRIIFTTVEPFGAHLFNKLSKNNSEDYSLVASYNSNQQKYVFKKMYEATQASALQESSKNKFQLKGKYKTSMGEGIPIGAYNVPQGSVVVKAGARLLLEGVDYTVDYSRGRVKILDPGLQASNTPIEISVENNAIFGQQTKRFFGVNVEHKFNENFLMGATFLKLAEKPMTIKSGYGEESVNNSIMGFNINYSTEVPFLTRLVNKLPNIDTDVPSSISFRGEFAYLMPGSSKGDQFGNEATSYIDDFEGAQSNIDIRGTNAWKLASTPVGYGDEAIDLSYGYRRGKLSWYTIDPIFYSSSGRPDGINENEVSSNRTRRIFSDELFPSKEIAYGESRVISTLDLTYYPNERGPYNYNPEYATSKSFLNPEANWGGVMRSLNTTNFEQANIEFLEFWLMDPYTGNPGDVADIANNGKLTFNLGFISEDILKDGHKQYENGLPTVGGADSSIKTIWGKVPASASLTYAFDTNQENRIAQDVGLDGLSDEEEAIQFPAFANLKDPAADNYEYFLNAEGNIIEKYKNYNGLEQNSPFNTSEKNKGSTMNPDVEDIDGDNTMNSINAYYEFSIDVKSDVKIGENNVVDIRVSSAELPNGNTTPVRWIQYKIPIEAKDGNSVGPISDLRSIRFMRMFLTGFKDEVTLRFGSLDLVRSEWRRFDSTLIEEPSTTVNGTNVGFDVTSVNLQENFEREPIPYVMPPEVVRQEVYTNNTVLKQNEQSLSLRVYQRDKSILSPSGLEPGDSKAVFKNVDIDMRQYKKLRMFLHAEALEDQSYFDRLKDDELVAFIRFGNDFTDNFYQVEIPLKLTEFGENAPDRIWRIENEIDLALELLGKLKVLKMNDATINPNYTFYKYEDELDPSLSGKSNKLRIGVKGNPNFGRVRTIMLGLKNQTDRLNSPRDLRGEVWFNELRMSDVDNRGGWAAVANMDTRFADFADFSATGSRSTIGFGGLEQGPNQRNREDFLQYNIATNVNLGQLLPNNWGINLPLNYSVGEEFSTPEYDPYNPDIRLKVIKEGIESDSERKTKQEQVESYVMRQSINFVGVGKQRKSEKKPQIYDIENITISHAYNEMKRRDYEIESYMDQQTRTSIDYSYAFTPKPVEPFKNVGFMKSNYWSLLKDFNFNYLPSNISFSTNILRQYNKQQYRLIDVQGIELDPIYRRSYFFNYNYGFNYNLSKALRLTYTAGTNNTVRNYYDQNNMIMQNSGIWKDYFDPGETNQHMQQLGLNYEIPINKIPFLSFIRSTYSYTGDFNWQRSSEAFSSVEDNGIVYNLGNTAQNANSHKFSTVFSLDQLYRSLGLVKSSDRSRNNKNRNKTKIVPGKKVERNVAVDRNKESTGNMIGDFAIGLLTSVKNVQINYTENNGTMLPGFLPNLGFFGTSKPSLGFVFGGQQDIRNQAARNGWLTNFPEFNQSFAQVNNTNLNFNAQVELLPALTIDIMGDRTYSRNFTEQFDVDNGIYNSRSPNEFGNFTISTIMIGTAFSRNDQRVSDAFDKFRENRIVVANRLAVERGIDINNPANLDAEGFPIGYTKNNQAVLLPSFLSAYTAGTDASSVSTSAFRKIPLPNWSVKYTGLMKLKWFKNNFRRFSLHHGYSSRYNIGAFSSNFEYISNSNFINDYGEYPVKNTVNNATLVELFNPLIRFDFETKTAFKILAEIRKDRTLSLSFDNNLLTEVLGNEYIVGFGYRIKDISFTSILANNGEGGTVTSDINIKADFTWRKNVTIVRYLDYNNNQLGAGQDMWAFKITADYNLSKNLTTIFFYDHTFSKAVISTTYPTTSVRSGLTLRYNF